MTEIDVVESAEPQRRLEMYGTPNFRDFGGYHAANGKKVKWGYLFRSGQLSNLTDSDLSLLDSLQLDLICDFRREEEQSNAPNRLPATRSLRVLSVPIIPGSNAEFFDQLDSSNAETAPDDGQSSPQAMYEFMVEINRDFALGQSDAYAKMFAEILHIDDAKFLVHCAAGKDRTGFAAAVFLMALGVSREVVMQDYLMTARYFLPELEMQRIKQKYEMNLPDHAILPMLEVHEEYLSAALGAIDSRYPSFETYLEEELNIGSEELAELRGRYLR